MRAARPTRPAWLAQVIMMVGNKADLAKTREVSFEEASRFAQENGPPASTIEYLEYH
jgi:hypothetical protein